VIRTVNIPARPAVEAHPMSRPAAVLAAALVALAAAPAAAAPPTTGTITGAVHWKGAAPARAPIDRASDPACAATARPAEDVVVEHGKLRDVLVRLAVGAAPAVPAPATPAVIVQHECMYAPRVVGLIAGQKLEVRNADATFHNVRGNLGAKVLWNLGQPAAAPAIERTDLGKPGDIVALKCDVHPWMSSWIAISDHPFFTVTGPDGAFTLANVPPGTYTLEAWHPTLGTKTVKVKVKKGKTAKAKLTFAAPPPAR
jgi:hypothetical protein